MPLKILQLIPRLRKQVANLFEQWQTAVRLRREKEERNRAAEDEQSWLSFEITRHRLSENGMRIGEVTGVRQHARTGTKGWVRWTDTNEKIAFWARGSRLTRGQLLALRGRERDGQ